MKNLQNNEIDYIEKSKILNYTLPKWYTYLDLTSDEIISKRLIFKAKTDTNELQLICDKPLEIKLDERIKELNNILIKQFQDQCKSYKLTEYMDYISKNNFRFKIFVYDMDLDYKVSRSFIIYFVEPIYKILYQGIISKTLTKPVKELDLSQIDLIRDKSTSYLFWHTMYFMDYISIKGEN